MSRYYRTERNYRTERKGLRNELGRTRGRGGVLGPWFLFVLVVPAFVGETASSQTFAMTPNPLRLRLFAAVANPFPSCCSPLNFSTAANGNQYHLVAPSILYPS